jgi:8-oxo-dGTP diphosphatase
MIGIIPAAGLGSRLGSMGQNLPKCLVAAGGEKLLDRTIQHLIRAGVSRIIVIVGHMAETVRNHVSHEVPDAQSCEIECVSQDRLEGLVSALQVVSPLVDDDSIVYCPDNYFADYYDIETALRLYETHRPDVLLCATQTEVRAHRPCLIGNFNEAIGDAIRVDSIGPGDGGAAWTSTGISVQNTVALSACCSEVSLSRRGGEVRLFDVWDALLSRGGKLMAYPIEGIRYDISTEEDLDSLAEALAGGKAGVATIVRTQDGRYILVQRDDKSEIRYPGYYALFGGGVETGETCEEAARRELQEEIGITVEDLEHVWQYRNNLKEEHVYSVEIDVPLSQLHLTEGKSFGAFDRLQIQAMKVRPDDLDALEYYWRHHD